MDGRDVSGFIARSADAVLEYIEAMRYVTDPRSACRSPAYAGALSGKGTPSSIWNPSSRTHRV